MLMSSNGYTRTALTYMVVGVTIFTVVFGVQTIFLRSRIVIILENRTGEEIVAWLFADLANGVRCLTFWRSCGRYWGWRGLLFLFLFLFFFRTVRLRRFPRPGTRQLPSESFDFSLEVILKKAGVNDTGKAGQQSANLSVDLGHAVSLTYGWG